MKPDRKHTRRRSRGPKTYRAPRLKVFGDIRAMTLKGGTRNDGGGKPKTRTGTG
jgi:hypothetical protein